MSEHEIHYGAERISFTLVRSDRATLEVSVHPDASVRVSSPTGLSDADVLAAVERRLRWIARHRAAALARQHASELRYVSGATHRYLGRQYRLRVVPEASRTRAHVALRGAFFWVSLREPSEAAAERALAAWYRERAWATVARRLPVCLDRARAFGVQPPAAWRIRTMRTRWGSFTPRGTLLVNPALVRAPLACVDYVLTHELCHTVYRHHGPAFYRLLDRVRPAWHQDRARLNEAAW